MDNETVQTIAALAAQVSDKSKPEQERRAALKHIAALRNEPEHIADSIPEEDLVSCANGVAVMLELGLPPLRIAETAEDRAKGRALRGAGTVRR